MNAKTFDVDFRLTVRTSVSINGAATLRIRCWCGRWVDGRPELVEEAHRQHIAHHRAAEGSR